MDLFLSLNGRIGRGKWWLGFVVLLIVQIVLMVILGGMGMLAVDPVTLAPTSAYWISLLVLMAVTIWPSICLYGKRFHDRNKSAWWIMIAFVPIIGTFWLLIECGFLRGSDGANDYGSDPLNAALA